MAATAYNMDYSTPGAPSSEGSVAPTFYLYGEPHQTAEDSFIHVESLDERSRPGDWMIRSHSHDDLAHVIHLSEGGGEMQVAGASQYFAAPCMLMIPAGVIHGFRWTKDTIGSIVTLATHRLSSLNWLAPDTAGLLSAAEIVALPHDESSKMDRHIAELSRELGWARVGHDAAVQSLLLAIFVIAMRERDALPGQDVFEARQRTIVARLRARIEERFRLREPVSIYAEALGVSQTTLRIACAAIAKTSPGAMIDQRAMLEARRLLLFSSMPVGEIGYAVGFGDQAYFSRFFTRNVGRSPRAYRTEQPSKAVIDTMIEGRRPWR